MLELTTRMAGISTSPKAAHGLSPKAAAGKAAANLRYITRLSAMGRDPAVSRLQYGNLTRPDGSPCQTRSDVLSAFRRAATERAKQGGKNGTRVAEKVMFSLPNDFDQATSNEVIARVIRRLSKGSPDVRAVGVNHRDKPGNNHAHLLLIDGLETEKQARKRRPDAKRLRRAEVIRMGEMGRPREVRELIAKTINQVAQERGLSMVEHRSFKERGLSHPTKHHGTRPRRADAIRITNAALLKKRSGVAVADGQTPAKPVAGAGGERAKPQASAPIASRSVSPPAHPSTPIRKRRRQADLEL